MAKNITDAETFIWQGFDKKGRKAKGEVQAVSRSMAKAQLRHQGVAAKTIKKKPKPLFGSASKSVSASDICIFSRQLATMMKAGVPLVQSFDIVAEALEKPRMKDLVIGIRNEVASGTSLAAALEKYPNHFDDLFVSLVDSGEQSGTLETMLDRIATYKEKSEALKSKIKSAMTYPIAVIVVAVVVTGILLVKVVPQFAATFSNFGSDLPAFTLFVVGLSDLVQAWWYIILLALAALVFAFRESRKRSERFSDAVDKYLLELPIFGGIIYNAIIARFVRTLSTTFAAGVPLVDALESVRGAAGNAVYSKAIGQIKDDVTSGLGLYDSIKSTNAFPVMLLQMVSIGEESGALDDMLEKVAVHYEAIVDDAVDSLSSLMEPIIMSILGVLVGGLMIAMYMPIFMLGSVV